MEFKSTDSVEKLEEVSKEALKQIEDKKYDISLKQNGIKEITYIGIAFCGKEIKISFKQKIKKPITDLKINFYNWLFIQNYFFNLSFNSFDNSSQPFLPKRANMFFLYDSTPG